MYTLQLLKAASRELSKLDKPIAKRIVKRLRWLVANFEDVKLKPLTGDLAGLYKLREGDYRIIYEILQSEEVIIIHSIGHRRDVYQKK